mmetsp:Transcript_16823/g.32859  ORF Transcript_16823/g.32859 Transcript_16823/m.32859 type:complete len:232 (+) Transcript_16823:1071-1766(+)
MEGLAFPTRIFLGSGSIRETSGANLAHSSCAHVLPYFNRVPTVFSSPACRQKPQPASRVSPGAGSVFFACCFFFLALFLGLLLFLPDALRLRTGLFEGAITSSSLSAAKSSSSSSSVSALWSSLSSPELEFRLVFIKAPSPKPPGGGSMGSEWWLSFTERYHFKIFPSFFQSRVSGGNPLASHLGNASSQPFNRSTSLLLYIWLPTPHRYSTLSPRILGSSLPPLNDVANH